jgi:hypothetical protein
MKMRKNGMFVAVTVAALALVLVGTPVPAQAQSEGMSVKIPFDFHAGGKFLAAGTYIVEKRGEALHIKDNRGHGTFVLSGAVPNRAPKEGNMLVFTRYADNYFLAEARWGGYSTARGFFKVPREIELGRVSPSEPVTIAATPR